MSEEKFNRLHIDCHTELGDLFIMEGLIRYFGDIYKNVTFTTDNVETARLMFAGSPHIIPIQHKANYSTRVRTVGDELKPDRTIRVGYLTDAYLEKNQTRDDATGLLNFDNKAWDREFYRHAGIDFKIRWSNTELPVLDLIPAPPAACFAEVLYHDRADHRIPAWRRPSNAELIRPVDGYPTAYSWVPPLLMAKEIHCIDSAFLNIVETLYGQGYLRGARLVFHRYARKTANPTMLAPWEVID
jgi:hypothetical protein